MNKLLNCCIYFVVLDQDEIDEFFITSPRQDIITHSKYYNHLVWSAKCAYKSIF